MPGLANDKGELFNMERPLINEFNPKMMVMTVCTITILCFLAACGSPTPATWAEKARVTSPDGLFDAVMTIETVGPVLGGGVYWNVFIVPKGVIAPKDDKISLLTASVLRGEKLIWKQNHLLEVQYDIAEIEKFRNFWGSNEVQNATWKEHEYLVELRLTPSSPDFSLLSPDGGVKRKD
jgi:hypothetical protein